MGLFSKKKKSEPQQQEQKPLPGTREMDPSIRPGGIFLVQLLMKEFCEMPPVERTAEVLEKHLGRVEAMINRKDSMGFFAQDYQAEFEGGNRVPVNLMINGCETFPADRIDERKRSQMWDCRNDRDRILSECKCQVVANDMLGGGLPSKVRANMLMDYLEALLELFPFCEAVYFYNSGKLLLADEIRRKEVSGLSRYIKYVVNARFFNINGTKDSVVDTLGMSLLYIQDLQYHFHGMEPNWVVEHAYNMAYYLLENDAPIKQGDTIDGMESGRIVEHIQWQCHFENAMIGPERAVMDVCMNEYAAGDRQYG